MIDQLELTMRSPAPAVSTDDVAALVRVLSEKNEWLTAEELAALLKFNDRKVRKVAAAAMPQVVSYPGSPGYRLFSACTLEEINHCIEAFQSQGRDMFKRSSLYLQAYHRRFRG